MTPSPHSPDPSLFDRLHLAARLAGHDGHADSASAGGLGVAESRCLAAIGAGEPLSLVDLARVAGQDKGQASRSAQALVARGLVRKEASTGDARAIALTLTRSGKPVFQKTVRASEARDTATFAALTVAERKTLAALLDRVIASLAPEPAPKA